MSKAFLILPNMESKEIKLNIQLTEKDYLTFLKTNQSDFKSRQIGPFAFPAWWC